MKIQIRIIVSVSVLAGSVGIIILAFCSFRNWYNSSVITDWIVSSEEQDTTERHRQNRGERYQILPDHILVIPDKGEDRHKLVRLDRQGKTEQIVTEEVVNSFLELDQKVYYDIQDEYADCWDMEDELSRIYCYDYETEEHTLLVEDQNINWFSIYQDEIIYICHDNKENLNKIFSCDLSGKNQKVLYQFKEYYDCQFFLTGDKILLIYDIEKSEDINNFQIAMLSLQTKELKNILPLNTWPWETFLLDRDLYVIQEGVLYQITLDLENGLADRKRLSRDMDYDEITCLYGRDTDLYSRNYDGEFRLLSERGNP